MTQDVLDVPQITYRETIAEKVSGVEGHFEHSLGRGAFAHVVIDLVPQPRDVDLVFTGADLVFVNDIADDKIPKEFISSVEKGILTAARNGVLCGYPVVDCEARLVSVSLNDTNSSPSNFESAGAFAFNEALKRAGMHLLEPIMKTTIVTPNDFRLWRDVFYNNDRCRGKLISCDDPDEGPVTIIKEIPITNLNKYIESLPHKQSGGRIKYSTQFSHFSPADRHIALDIIKRRNGLTQLLATGF